MSRSRKRKMKWWPIAFPALFEAAKHQLSIEHLTRAITETDEVKVLLDFRLRTGGVFLGL